METLTIDQMRQAVLDAGFSIEANTDPSNRCLFIASGPSGTVLGDDESALVATAYQQVYPTAA
jgi:hypothetical protein